MKQPILYGSALTLLAGLTLGSLPAHADAIINGALTVGENTLEDLNGDRVLDASGNVLTSGTFAEGDVIESLLRFDSVNADTINVAVGILNYQLVAYSRIVIPDDPTDNVGSAINNGNGTFTVFFSTDDAVMGANVFAEIYENTTLKLDFEDDVATAISTIRATTLIAEFGIGEADDFWSAILPLDIAILATDGAGSPQNPAGQFGLSLITNDGNLPFEANGIQSNAPAVLGGGNFHTIVGSASAFANPDGFNDGWLVGTNTEVRGRVAVPEPSVLLLMGAGLLGAGFARKRASA